MDADPFIMILGTRQAARRKAEIISMMAFQKLNKRKDSYK